MNPLLPATVAMLALAAPTPPPTTSAVVQTRPEIVVPPGPLAIGQQITVTLHHWPAGTVQLEICGNNARRGALDCANDQATHAQVPAAGMAVTPILVAAPPVACPCLLRARNLTGAVQATATLPLAGVTAPPAPAPTSSPELAVDELRVAERGPLRGWFGFPEELTVHLTLRNPGPADVVDPAFTLLFGPAGQAHTIVAAPALGTIEPGQAREYEIRVPMDLAVIGKHELHGRVDLPERPVAFVIETTRYPWGLLVLAAILAATPVALRPRSPRPRHQRHPAEGRPEA
ncbi:hypothetical protein AB0C02_22575 [Micromonospora sp. NPDC048999]|uniref:hypothetical protein n=1 Tax=Micromonospora sp. NPDC048999 TaxID=3155391 RepID=UPI0033DA6CB4